MAITWGNAIWGSRCGLRLGYEASTSGQTTTVKIYAQTYYSISDSSNTFSVTFCGSSQYNGSKSINTSNDSSGWNNQVELWSGSTTNQTWSISASITDIEAVGKSNTASVSGSGTAWTSVGTPSVSITDNGNNTFSISATKGSNGTNNAATGVGGICYSFDNSNWTYESSGSVSSDTTVYASAYTTGTYNNSDWAYTNKVIKYYSKPGKPTVTISDNGLGTVTISATKGSNGSNNVATDVSDIQYSFNNSTWINYSSPFTVSSSQTVYARARTKGTYTGNSNAYLYSDYTIVSSSVTTITKCDKPNLSLSSTMLHFNDNNLILSISATPGVNNDITGYEIQYSGSDTLTFTNWSTISSLSTSEDIYDFDFATGTSYFNILKSLNKKYICFRVKTIGSVSGYDSDYNYISIMTDKGYPRFKNSEDVYENCIPYILKKGTWTQCVLNSSIMHVSN